MNQTQAVELLNKYCDNKCSPEEVALVESWGLHLVATSDFKIDYTQVAVSAQRIWENINPNPKPKLIGWYIASAIAAVTLLFIGVTLFHNYNHKVDNYPIVTKNLRKPEGANGIVGRNDREPAANKATLTLSNGQQIQLNSSVAFESAIETKCRIRNSKEGKLIYIRNTNAGTNVLLAMNSLTTPRGGKYQVVLPDGSTVYLNADSRLTYPTQFAKSERRVQLQGEGYFEVTKDASRPFKVESVDQTVSVTGTHFNVHSYTNETVRTTLLEGKISIQQTSTGKSQPLNPGQQATLTPKGIQVSNNVNATDAIKWKDGLFIFSQTLLKDALMEIGRWYNVDVDDANLPEGKRLVAECNANLKLSSVLNYINGTSQTNLIIDGNVLRSR